jgi:hypothetical protein
MKDSVFYWRVSNPLYHLVQRFLTVIRTHGDGGDDDGNDNGNGNGDESDGDDGDNGNSYQSPPFKGKQKEVIFGLIEDLKRYKRSGVKAESEEVEEVEETKFYHLHNII